VVRAGRPRTHANEAQSRPRVGPTVILPTGQPRMTITRGRDHVGSAFSSHPDRRLDARVLLEFPITHRDAVPSSRTSSTAQYRCSTTLSSTSTPGLPRCDQPCQSQRNARNTGKPEPETSPKCRPPTGTTVAQLPEPRPQPVAQEPEPRCPASTGTAHLTDEQTWSKHGRESASDQAKEMVKTPGQNGCAARDSNPEPAD
jgi:hypothetical protein